MDNRKILFPLLLGVAFAPELAEAQQPQPSQPIRLEGLRIRGKFVVRTQIQSFTPEPGSPLPRLNLSRVGKVLTDTKVLSALAEALSSRIILERDVDIVSQRCGRSNAFYDPNTYSITLCDELFAELEALFSHMGPGPAFNDAVLGATTFFVLHEVGHAVVHQFNIPLIAREEDIVDGIASYLVLTAGLPSIAFAGASSFSYMGARRQAGQSLDFWDEHSIHEQRFYNIACWIYGSNPTTFSYLVQTNTLPQKRAQRCGNEYRQLVDGIVRLLGPKLNGGR